MLKKKKEEKKKKKKKKVCSDRENQVGCSRTVLYFTSSY